MRKIIIIAVIVGVISGFIQNSFAITSVCSQDKKAYKRVIKIKDADIKETLSNELLALALADNCDTKNW